MNAGAQNGQPSRARGSMNVTARPANIDYRHLLLIGVFLLPVAVYWSTATSVFEVWLRSNTFAHGIIVFPFALYLLFDRRDRLAGLSARPSPAGYFLLLILALAWYVAALAKASVAQQLSLALMMSASVLLVFGAGIASRLAFPLLYILFAVPVGEFLVGPLMTWTAEFTVLALQVTGIPVFKEGMFFRIPSGNFEVAKACSGIRYLIASVSLGVLYANLFLRTRWRQWVFVAISVAVPVIANGFRAYGIVMIAHLSDMKLAVGIDHIIYGWVFFGVVMLLMFSFGWRLRAGEDRAAERQGKDEPAAPARAVAQAGPGSQQGKVAFAIGLALITMLVPRILLSQSAARPAVAATSTARLPLAQGDWRGPSPLADASWTPLFSKAASRGIADYTRGGDTVTVFLAIYDADNPDAEMVSWENKFYQDPWKAISSASHRVLVGGDGWNVRESLIFSRGQRKLLWHWYETNSMRSGADLLGKVAETLAALPLRDDMPRTVILATDAGDDTGRARDVLTGFLTQMYAGLQVCAVASASSEADGRRPPAPDAECQSAGGH